MFQIAQTSFETKKIQDGFQNPSVGGFAVFEGWVRSRNDGRSVRFLEYEIFEPLACKEAGRILQEAKEKFAVLDVRCVHRAGRLEVGEIAVWVGAAAAHRDAAFKACRYVIDEIKARLPIWKKEYYEDGASGWVSCEHGHDKKIDATGYYARQTVLPQIGVQGQQKIINSKVLVVGAGGLGSAVLMSLAAAGVGTLGICESDALEGSNLHRQTLYSHQDIGRPKAELAAERIEALNPLISVRRHDQRLDAGNIKSIAGAYDILVDCSDNFESKFLLNDFVILNEKVLVQASVYQFEGQVRVYDPKAPSACLRCLWPEIPPAGCVGTCVDVGILGVVPAILGNIQALEVLKIIAGLDGVLHAETLLCDLTTYEIKKIRQRRDSGCPLCGENPTIHDVHGERNSQTAVNREIDLATISPAEFQKYQLVDVREGIERTMIPLHSEAIHFPLSQFQRISPPLEKDKKYLLFCAQGVRSRYMTDALRSEGFTDVFSLSNGAAELNLYLDKHSITATQSG